jgi:hypothetical protein
MRMCAIAEPTTGLEAKFSLRHTAAMVLSGVDTAAISSFGDATVEDTPLLSLRERVAVVCDRDGGGPTPVEVRTTDGRVLTRSHDTWAPERDLGRQRARLEAKFSSLAVPVVGERSASAIARLAGELERLGDLAGLMAAARGDLPG